MKYSIVVLCLVFGTAVSAQRLSEMNIGERTLTFVDSSRNNRPLVTEVWYPTTDSISRSDKYSTPFLRGFTVRNGRLPSARLPLIMLSHGTGGGRKTLEWLAQGLVNQGFVVVAVDHFGNTYDHKIALMFFEFWQRPLDISFVLTRVLADRELAAMVDTSKIGATGFSIGGYTVIGLAGGVADLPMMLRYYRNEGHREIEFPEFPGLNKMLEDSTLLADSKQIPDLKDNRIKAVFAINPGMGVGFTREEQVRQITVPVFIVGSRGDSMAPAIPNARRFHQVINGSAYYEFPGKTGHYVMLNEASAEMKKEEPGAFVDDKTVNRHLVHATVDSLAGKFFRASLIHR